MTNPNNDGVFASAGGHLETLHLSTPLSMETKWKVVETTPSTASQALGVSCKMSAMNDTELDAMVRVAIATSIRGRGAIPAIAEVAQDLGHEPAVVDASFARMIDQHVFIPRKGSHEIYAYDPFCADPTGFRVDAAGREWWAICGWDALGVPPALGTSGTIDARCGDCGDAIRIEVGPDGRAGAPSGTLLQIGVPARDFWKDIYFT